MSALADAVRADAPRDVRVIAQRLGLRLAPGARADRARVMCPWHDEKRPSCSIGVRAGSVVAHCFACGEGGDLLSLVAVTRGLDIRSDFVAVARETADLFDIRVDDVPPARRMKHDPVAVVAAAIEQAATDWRDGRAVSLADAATIEGATTETRAEAFALLARADATQAALDDELERLAIEHKRRAR